MLTASPAPHDLLRSRILLVDDEPRNLLLLERSLESAGYHDVHATPDSSRVLPLCAQIRPDLLLLDLHMPGVDGFQLLREINTGTTSGRYLPVLVLTADATEHTKRRALGAGAHDFLTKPFSITEVLLRIRNLLETRALYLELEHHNQQLNTRVAERTRELEAARLEVLERLCQAVEFRHDVTGRHTRRVGERSAELADRAGLPSTEVDRIRRAAPLHDVGKIAIPDAVLQKPGRLTREEFELMQQHTVFGGRILAGGGSELMELAESIALCHHERWDGSGYPQRLAGDQIPVAARIVSIVDVFDAITSDRGYRDAWPIERAIEEIRLGAGRQFDPELVEAFLSLSRSARSYTCSLTS
jgi:putative two-component system response regulator